MTESRTLAGPLLSLAALVFLTSAPLALKFGGLALGVAYLALLAAAVAAIVAIERGGWGWLPGARWQAAVWALLLVVALAVLFPLAQARVLGPGSDRDEALVLAIQALLEFRFPYYEKTYFGNPITPMPGALFIGMPFHLLGSPVLQNIAFTLAAGFALAHGLRGLQTRWLIVALLTLGNLSFLQDYVTGGDYAVNAAYVGLAFQFAALALRDEAWGWRTALAAVLLGVTMCSRPVFVIAGAVLFFNAWRCRGLRPAVRFAVLAFGTSALLALPFYLHDPASFSPLHVANKLPEHVRFLALVLPVAALATAFVLAFRPLSHAGLFGALAVGVGVMILPAAAIGAAESWGGIRQGLMGATYLLPVSLYGGVAVLRRFLKP